MTKLNNLTELAEFLKNMDNDSPRRKLGFDMGVSYIDRDGTNHPCGSACCIGGWVQFHNKATRHMWVEDALMTICPDGTLEGEAYKLCYPDGIRAAWKATPQQAARAVEILRDTGKCDWDRAMTEVPA